MEHEERIFHTESVPDYYFGRYLEEELDQIVLSMITNCNCATRFSSFLPQVKRKSAEETEQILFPRETNAISYPDRHFYTRNIITTANMFFAPLSLRSLLK